MKTVTYITENTIMKFLYNPKKTFLEGFVKEWLRFDSGTYQDYGKYVRFLKVAIRDNVSELYMQGYPWGTQKGCKDRPLGYIDNAAKFDRVAVIIDSSKIWPLVGSSSIEAFLEICTDAIHECRWAILKDAIQKRGHEAVADFVGTDISSDTYDRVMDETEAQMPDEEFERFWEKYI